MEFKKCLTFVIGSLILLFTNCYFKTKKKTMETHKKLPLEYVIREPQVRTKRSPVIFMLHGYGSNEEDLFSFADELPKEYTIISLRAPYNLTSFGYAWYMINFDEDQAYWSDNEQAIESRELIMRCIDEACKVYDLDTRNINLLGFSQGSILRMASAAGFMSIICYFMVHWLPFEAGARSLYEAVPKFILIVLVSLSTYLMFSRLLQIKESEPDRRVLDFGIERD